MKKLLIGLLVVTFTLNVLADDPHHDPESNIIYETIVEETIIIEDSSVMAMAMGQHQFDYGTYADQKAISAAITETSEALSAGFAHRNCKECGLWSGSIGLGRINNNYKAAAAVGYTWRY